METNIEPSEMAHPVLIRTYTNSQGITETEYSGGLTIREHFASMFMTALLQNPRNIDAMTKEDAHTAVTAADELLKELNKNGNTESQ